MRENFYKVEKRTKDASKVDRLLFELRIYSNPVFPFSRDSEGLKNKFRFRNPCGEQTLVSAN
jgi:hypothetical protein